MVVKKNTNTPANTSKKAVAFNLATAFFEVQEAWIIK